MQRYRLLTRSDLDGLVSAAILVEAGCVEEIEFVHPRDVRDGHVAIDKNDLLVNLPVVSDAGLRYGSDQTEQSNIEMSVPSAARQVLEIYKEQLKDSERYRPYVELVEKVNNRTLGMMEVIKPVNGVLLAYLIDPRTGLGRHRDFKVSNYFFMMDMIDYIKMYAIEEVLDQPDVVERIKMLYDQYDEFVEQGMKVSKVDEGVLIQDYRNESNFYVGNRFVKYVLYPDIQVSINVFWGLKKKNMIIAVGQSIFDQNESLNVGEIMAAYNGGGNLLSGTCQVDNESADDVLKKIVQRLHETVELDEEN